MLVPMLLMGNKQRFHWLSAFDARKTPMKKVIASTRAHKPNRYNTANGIPAKCSMMKDETKPKVMTEKSELRSWE